MDVLEWSYFPRNRRPDSWAVQLVDVVSAHAEALSTTSERGTEFTRLRSDGVLAVLRDDLELLGYEVESGKGKGQRIERPVLYGDNGRPSVTYEIDAFHDRLGIAVEVEAGRGAMSNAEHRDIIRASLLLDASHLVLLMPLAYRYSNGGKRAQINAFAKTRDQLDAIYASQRLRLPFESVLLIGY